MLDAGAAIYETYCASCHQRDGRGDGARFPPLASTTWVSGNRERLISIVLNGLEGSIEVEGTAYNGVMPAHGFLSDAQIAQLLSFLRLNFGNHANGISASDVAAERKRPAWKPAPSN